MGDQRGSEPPAQGHERDRRHPLGPPVSEPRLGGPKAHRAAKRGAKAIPVHQFCPAISRLASQAASVSTTLAATTIHPEAYMWRSSKPRTVSQTDRKSTRLNSSH